MALPPPVKIPDVSPDAAALHAAALHAAAVEELERCLDASLAGKRPGPDGVVQVILPTGDHGDHHDEIIGRYLAAGWGKAEILNVIKLPDDKGFATDPRGHVLYLTP